MLYCILRFLLHRVHNSWLLRAHEVSTPELGEVFAINTLAPFILCARLKPMLLRGRYVPKESKSVREDNHHHGFDVYLPYA